MAPATDLDRGVHDDGGHTLTRLVNGLPAHLTDRGEAWLVLSDLAELIGLRAPDAVPSLIADAGLTVRDRLDAPTGYRGGDGPLAALRARETVSLWRLRAA